MQCAQAVCNPYRIVWLFVCGPEVLSGRVRRVQRKFIHDRAIFTPSDSESISEYSLTHSEPLKTDLDNSKLFECILIKCSASFDVEIFVALWRRCICAFSGDSCGVSAPRMPPVRWIWARGETLNNPEGYPKLIQNRPETTA